jgi:hypothetical protein
MSLRGYAIDWHGRCPYCGVTLTDGDVEAPTKASKDHMVPQRCGGQIHRNLVYSCLLCNRDKHHLSLLEWRVVKLMRRQSPFFAWDVDVPGVLWRWLIFNVYLSGSLSKLLILSRF